MNNIDCGNLLEPLFGQTKPTELHLDVVSIVSLTGCGFSITIRSLRRFKFSKTRPEPISVQQIRSKEGPSKNLGHKLQNCPLNSYLDKPIPSSAHTISDHYTIHFKIV